MDKQNKTVTELTPEQMDKVSGGNNEQENGDARRQMYCHFCHRLTEFRVGSGGRGYCLTCGNDKNGW